MTITLTREEAQQVLDALKYWDNGVDEHAIHLCVTAIETLRARLAQPEPEPEPVAWLHSFTGYGWQVVPEKLYPTDQPLYTAPPQHEWQGLTEQDFSAINQSCSTKLQAATSAESILKEKNSA